MLFDVPYVLPDELLVWVLWLFEAVVLVLPCRRLIMSFQLVVEHPPSTATSAPATAVMRNVDVLISHSPFDVACKTVGRGGPLPGCPLTLTGPPCTSVRAGSACAIGPRAVAL